MQKYKVHAVVRYVGRDSEGKQVSGGCFIEDIFHALSHDENFVLAGAEMAVQNSVNVLTEQMLADVQVTAFYITSIRKDRQ